LERAHETLLHLGKLADQQLAVHGVPDATIATPGPDAARDAVDSVLMMAYAYHMDPRWASHHATTTQLRPSAEHVEYHRFLMSHHPGVAAPPAAPHAASSRGSGGGASARAAASAARVAPPSEGDAEDDGGDDEGGSSARGGDGSHGASREARAAAARPASGGKGRGRRRGSSAGDGGATRRASTSGGAAGVRRDGHGGDGDGDGDGEGDGGALDRGSSPAAEGAPAGKSRWSSWELSLLFKAAQRHGWSSASLIVAELCSTAGFTRQPHGIRHQLRRVRREGGAQVDGAWQTAPPMHAADAAAVADRSGAGASSGGDHTA
jgi:hypothetical protein